jgi:isopentenyl diphosphate isomerase/L-lactate dehydrogenase-like FMN-dependent dehydrogenase
MAFKVLCYPITGVVSLNCKSSLFILCPLLLSRIHHSAPASIDVLAELRQRRPDILDEKKLEIYIDGGVRRGTDVLKALCLGATAVGLGRPFLFGNAAYGEEGARHVISSKPLTFTDFLGF